MKKVFRLGNNLPPLIQDLTRAKQFEALEPGSETWVTPWSARVNADGEVFLLKTAVERDRAPGGTLSLKVVKDFDGIVLDATALSAKDLADRFRPTEGSLSEGIVGASDEGFEPVIGVLYPNLDNLAGMEAGAVQDFNHEQAAARQRFADYFDETFHREYKFAQDEYPGFREFPGLDYSR